jgi:hypothetical protein
MIYQPQNPEAKKEVTIESIGDTIESMGVTLESTGTAVESLKVTIESLMGLVATSHTNLISFVESKSDEIIISTKNGFDEMGTRIDGLEFRMDGLESKMDMGFNRVQTAIDAIHSDYTLRREHDLLRGRVKNIERKIGVVTP